MAAGRLVRSFGRPEILAFRSGRIVSYRHQAVFSRTMSSLNEQFEAAKSRLASLKDDPGNDTKLKIYALFKQFTVGKCNTSRPGMLDLVGKAKWDAWQSLGSMSKDEAAKKYIGLINGLAGEEAANPAMPTADGKYTTLLVTQEGPVRIITLNRPSKKNAISLEMYEEIMKSLEEAAADEATVITVVTGSGDFFCSGNDLSNFSKQLGGEPLTMAKNAASLLQRYVASYIDFPKPLVAILNGPAVGIGVTVLALFDLVYATEKATLHTPFTILGQSAEGCSSYLFPRIMGAAKANELLLLNKRITAAEAYERGLVTEVFGDSVFQKEVWARIREIGKLPRQALRDSKTLIRGINKDVLHEVNKKECELLTTRWVSEECMQAIMDFMTRKTAKL